MALDWAESEGVPKEAAIDVCVAVLETAVAESRKSRGTGPAETG
jgi:hypothetical protein